LELQGFSIMILKTPHYITALLLCLISLFGFIVYLQLYQGVLDEGAQLLDQHCIALNPLIIRRKQAYIAGLKTLQASGSAGLEPYLAYQDQYLAAAKEYVHLEKLWLRQEEAYLKRSDVQLLLDQHLKDAAGYQVDMYRSELQGTAAIIRMFAEKDSVKQQGLVDIIAQTDREQKIAQQGYELKYGKRRADSLSFRDRFITPPTLQCPEENTRFPDVDQELGL
jgi:hypothetical protein